MSRADVARQGGERFVRYTILNLRPHGDVSLEGRPYAVVPLDVPLPVEESELRVVLIRLADSKPTRRVQAVAALCRRVLPASAIPNQSLE